MARVQVKTFGAKLVARRLDRLAQNAEDIRPAQPAVARRVAAGYGRAFDRQGPGWSPLKPSAVRRRISEGYSAGPILDRTGSYKSAATNPLALNITARSHSFTIAINHKVAKFHQSGTKSMAARKLILSFGDRTALSRVIADHLVRR
jgi:hypothetical protein